MKGKIGVSGGEDEYDEFVVEEGSATILLYVRFCVVVVELCDFIEEFEK